MGSLDDNLTKSCAQLSRTVELGRSDIWIRVPNRWRSTMVRKIMIALAAVTFAGAVAASTAVDARMGGGGGGRGGGSVHGAMMGGGIRSGAFVGSRSVAFHSGSARFNRVAFARHHR